MSDKKSSGNRLKEVRERLGLRQIDFARSFGLQNKGLSAIENGRSKLGEDHLRVLVEKFQVNPLWILLGEGQMLLSEDSSVSEPAAGYGNSTTVEVVTVDTEGNSAISQVNSKARGGYVSGGYLEPEYLSELPVISLPGARFRNGTFRAFEVAGDSMQTTLHTGDIVIAQKLHNWPTEIREGYVHIVVTHDDIVVKRLLNRLNETSQLVLQSDNIQYPTQLLDGIEVREIWLARAYISSQFTNARYDTVREVANTQADVAELAQELKVLREAVAARMGVPARELGPIRKKLK